jgi:hypothetical protein
LVATTLLLAAPKCLLCLAAWAGLAASFLPGDTELCGGTAALGPADWLARLTALPAVVLLVSGCLHRFLAPRP